MIKTLNELDRAINKRKVTFLEKQTFETYVDVYQFMATHKMLDISSKLKVDVNGNQILNELYTKDDRLYELETLYNKDNVFLYAIVTEVMETK